MDSKMKMVTGIALIISVLSAAFIATPALAEANGSDNGDQLTEQERLRIRDMSCDREKLRTQEREQLRSQDCSCECEQPRTQTRERLREQNQTCNAECDGYRQGEQNGQNGARNCADNLEQHRNHHRRGNPGL